MLCTPWNQEIGNKRKVSVLPHSTSPPPPKKRLILYHCNCSWVFLKIPRLEENGIDTEALIFRFPFRAEKAFKFFVVYLCHLE